MIKRLLFLIILFFFLGTLWLYFKKTFDYGDTASFVKKEWVRQFGSAAEEYITSIITDQSGNIIVSGGNDGTPGPGENQSGPFLTQFDLTGKMMWINSYGVGRYGGPIAIDKLTGGILVANSGSPISQKPPQVEITRDWRGVETLKTIGDYNFSQDVILTKFKSTGEKIFSVSFGSPKKHDYPIGMAIDDGGNIFISGNSNTGHDDNNMFLYKLDFAGNVLWRKDFESNGQDVNRGFKMNTVGDVYLAGESMDKTGRGIVLIKMDSSGNELLKKTVPVQAANIIFGGMSVDRLGNIFVTGYLELPSRGAPKGNGFLMKIDARGEQKYLKPLNFDKIGAGKGITIDNEGNIYLTGSCNDWYDYGYEKGGCDAYFAKFDTDGNKQWIKKFRAKGYTSGEKIILNSAGSIIVSGTTSDSVEEGKKNIGKKDVFLSLWKSEK